MKNVDDIDVTIKEALGTDWWLENNGILTETLLQQLLFFGYFSSTVVKHVEFDIDQPHKIVKYQVSVSRNHHIKYRLYKFFDGKFKNPSSILGKLIRLQLNKLRVYMDIEHNIVSRVSDYLPDYKVEVAICLI